MSFRTNAVKVQAFAGAMFGVQVGSTTMSQVNADITSAGGLANALNGYYASSFGGATTASVAATVAANLGLTGDALTAGTAYIAAQLNGAAAGARGSVISTILDQFAGLASDATFGAAATAYNAKVATATAYTGTDNVAIGTVVVASTVFTLTAGTDLAGVASASNAGLASTFKFSSGNEVVDGMSATIQAADTLVDGSTTDKDVLNITATAAMNAMTAVNIETVNVALASGSPTAVFTNFSGLKDINVTGAVAGTVTDANASSINVSGYTRVLTVNETLIDGTATAGNADITNITVSGLSFGTTAATQSGITLTAGTAGVLETLNITSSGAAANTFALDAGTNVALSTVNLLGDANVTVRVDHDDISGITINGAANNGVTTLLIDRQGDTTTSTNLTNVNGIDVYGFRDSTAGADSVVVSGIVDGATVDVRSTFNTADNNIGVRNATSSTTNVLNVNLDHATADTRVQFGTANIQDVETLNLASSGHATALIAAGNEVSLIGDMTAIAMTGDTAIALTVNIDAPTTGTRSTAINASAMTAAVSVTAVNDTNTTNLYTITGSALSDTLVGGAGVNVINGGEGNDAITGGAANDTIDGGAGNDTVTVTAGTDTVTGGAGNDTYDVNGIDVTAVAQIGTITPVSTGAVYLAGETIVVTIDGVARTYALTASDVGGTASTDDILLISASLVNFINANFTQVVATNVAATGVITVTAAVAGTPFTLVVTDTSADAESDYTEAEAATANTAGVSINTRITDFAAGDILDLDGIITEADLEYQEGTYTANSTANVVVLTGAAFATVAAAEDLLDNSNGADDQDGEAVVIFLNSTLGFAQAFYDGAQQTDGNLTATIIDFTGITTLSQLAAAFSADSFIV